MKGGGRSARLREGAVLVLILVGAALLRLWALDSQPGGLYPDEAAEGVGALAILRHSGAPPVFFHDDGGREALFAYFVAFAFRIFGAGAVVLRATAAVIGVAGVAAIYVALRRFSRTVALGGALWAAGSLWLVVISRDGMRNIMCVAVGGLIVAALLAWYDRPSRRATVLAGAATALGFWTYQPLKLVPLVVLAWLWLLWRNDRARAMSMLRWWRQGVGAFGLVVLPIVIAALTNPHAYFNRGVGVTVVGSWPGVLPFAGHIAQTLAMFFATGDPNARHNVAQLPLLGIPLSLLAAVGVIRAWRNRGDGAHLLLLVGGAVMLVPPLISVEGGTPHFLRSLGLAPYVAAFVGLGIADLVARAPRVHRDGGRLTLTACCVLLTLLGVASGLAYFRRPVSARYAAYTFDLVAIADATAGGPSDVAVVSDYDAQVVRFLDDSNPPATVPPNGHISKAAVYSLIVARSPSAIAQVVGGAAGAQLAARAHPIAFSPVGVPSVYAVIP